MVSEPLAAVLVLVAVVVCIFCALCSCVARVRKSEYRSVSQA